MAEHSAIVLGGVLPSRKDLLSVALLQLNPELFVNEVHRNIFVFLQRFYDRAGGVMPLPIFTAALESSDIETAKVLAYTQAFKTLVEMEVPEPDFRWALGELQNDFAKRQTGIIIATGMQILERGYDVGQDFLKGHEDARRFIAAEVHKLDRLGSTDAAPEGNIFSEADAIMQEYVSRRDSKTSLGIMTGIHSIDRVAGGFQNGEMTLVCAYTNQGKSQFVTQTAWDASVMQGKNVLFATSETVRGTAIRRIISRHSRLPQFGKPGGLNSSDLKRGKLTREDEKILAAVLDDWKNNPNYGQLNIVQVPRGATLDYVDQRLRQFGLEVGCDLVIEDYLALLTADVRRTNEREEFNTILKNAKLMAVSHNNGVGVPLISPWAMKQDAFKEALRTRRYYLANLSDTSEAEKSSDQIIALFRDPESTSEMQIQWLKMRDEAIPPIHMLEIDFRSTYIGAQSSASSFGMEGATNHDDLLALTQ